MDKTAARFGLYIFDFDGTLVNTMELWDQMTRRYLLLYGLEITDERLDYLNTLDFERCLAYFVEELGIPGPVERVKLEWNDFAVGIFLEEARILPGVDLCLARLREGGARIALFTLSPRPLVELLLNKLGLAPLLDVTFMGGETEAPKNQPASFLEITGKMGVSPSRTAVVEDSPYAVRVAAQAGLHTVGVAVGNKHAEALRQLCDEMIEDYSTWR